MLEAVAAVRQALLDIAEGDSPGRDPVSFADADWLPPGVGREVFKMEAMAVIRKFIQYCFGIPVRELPMSVAGILKQMLGYLAKFRADAASSALGGSSSKSQ